MLACAKRSAEASLVGAVGEANRAWFRADKIVGYDTNGDTNMNGTGAPSTEVVEER